jgi:hypothetical protein
MSTTPQADKKAILKKLTQLEPGMMHEFLKDAEDDFEGPGAPSRNASGMPHVPRKNRDLLRTPWTRMAPREKAILDAGWAHIQSVSYRVSTRWLFYRLLQDGFYKDKKDYDNKFTHLFSRARHTNQDDWRPDSLEDEGRDILNYSGGCKDDGEAVEWLRQKIEEAAEVPFDHFYKQENYVELWYEANAMTSQFEHYTDGIDLVPMAGTPSIIYKWKIARRLEDRAERYGLPIKILYFGDCDPAGHGIAKTLEMDVRRWTDTEFDLVWCGLTAAQAKHYRIPESIDKPGAFQWEAASDRAAKEIITKALGKYLDIDVIDEAQEAAEEFKEKSQAKIDQLLKELDEETG